jgi:hypothetical protein
MMAMSTRALAAKYLATGLATPADIAGYAALASDPMSSAVYHGVVRGIGFGGVVDPAQVEIQDVSVSDLPHRERFGGTGRRRIFGRIIQNCDPSGSRFNLRLAVPVEVVAMRAA